jgi:hypothetical protein
VVELTVYSKQQPFSHVLCLGMHSNVMLRFIVHALQDPPLCSSTVSALMLFCAGPVGSGRAPDADLPRAGHRPAEPAAAGHRRQRPVSPRSLLDKLFGLIHGPNTSLLYKDTKP